MPMYYVDDQRSGFKLVDLIIAVFVVAVVLAFLVPALHRGHSNDDRTQCQSHMRQIGMSLTTYLITYNSYPNAATIFDDPSLHQGDPLKSILYRTLVDPQSFASDPGPLLRSWVVDCLPYLDFQDLANDWKHEESYLSLAKGTDTLSNFQVGSTPVSLLCCPKDPTASSRQGSLSYVVNGGFTRWPAVPVGWSGGAADGQSDNDGVLEWAARGSPWQENQAVGQRLGVMFLGTSSGNQPWDIRTNPKDITDGSSNTLLIAENVLAGRSAGSMYAGALPTNWACPLPNFTMFLGSDDVCHTPQSSTDCLGGQLRPRRDGADGPGWAKANAPKTFENINYGQNLTVKGSFPYANSAHPGGGNFVFCDGHTSFLTETIDGTVYAKLITPAGARLPDAIKQGPLNDDVFAQ